MKTKKRLRTFASVVSVLCGCFIVAALAHSQTFEVLHVFNGTDGANPFGPVVQGSDGNFYGTTEQGGDFGHGTVFKMNRYGLLTRLISFNNINGSHPDGGLVQGSDGYFYGTTDYGGSYGYGTVFKVTTNGTLTTLLQFKNTNGAYPAAAPVQGSDGNLYGTTQGVSADPQTYGTVFRILTNGTVATLASFNNANGAHPVAALVQGSDGSFYGTTRSGGSYGYGTIFNVATNGVLTSLVSFDGSGGSVCSSSLVQGTNGSFYGDIGLTGGSGSVFQMTPAGNFTTLAWFNGGNGAHPWAGLVQASDGNFYGTTRDGGAYDSGGFTTGIGTVFEMTPDGTLTTLVSFNETNGGWPEGALVQGTDGNLYGTTYIGGNLSVSGYPSGAGTIFRIVMPAPPVLNIAQSGNQFVLSWPTNQPSYKLQWATNLTPPAIWNDSTDPQIMIGTQLTITNTNSAAVQFFRLKRP